MFTKWIPHRLKALCRVPRPQVAGCRRAFRPRLEALEDRALPSTVTWDGGGATNNWTDRFNWKRDKADDIGPFAGDDLVFPDGAARLSNFNNFPSGTSFHSIKFSGSGYIIAGGSLNVLNLGTGGITNSATSGTNRYDGPIQLDDVRTINVAGGGQLNLGGVLSGGGGFSKIGQGTLTLNGTSANTFTGSTSVSNGLLQLDKGGDTASAIAIPGQNLNITAVSGSPVVRVLRSEQIADNATVTLTEVPGRAQLHLNAKETIGGLNMSGGDISSSGGSLVLRGNVTASPSTADPPAPATISAPILLGTGAGRFTVNGAAGFPDIAGLQVSGDIRGFSLSKEGAGVMELNRNRSNDAISTIVPGVDVSAGTLLVNDTQAINQVPVTVRNDATLGGSGKVSAVATQGGAGVGPVDDNDPLPQFGASTGWSRVSGQSFNNEFLVADPRIVSGRNEAASWAFTGLTPGLYRVFATWTAGNDRSSRVNFSFIDVSVGLVGFPFINEEQAPVGGPKINGVVFQQLGGPVNITSGTLRVNLQNDVSAESDGALVVADAIYIERLAGTISPGGVGTAVGTLSVTNGVTLDTGSTYRVDFVNTAPGVNSVDLLQCRNYTTFGTLLALSASSFSPPDPGTPFRIITITGSGLAGNFENVRNSNRDTIQLVAGNGERHTFTINYNAGDGNDVDLVYQNTATQVSFLELSPGVINEGERVTLRGALTDPNRGDVLALRINWGDGTVQTFTDLGTRPFRFTHTYADNSPVGSPYLVRVEWFDQHGAGNFRTLSVTVNNVPPRLFLGGAEAVRAGEVMRHRGRFTDPGADTWTARVDYGDGSGPQPLVILPGQQLSFEHRYARPGSYRVTVTVLDDDGGLGTDTFLVLVLPPL